ncbi:DMT family transporter [Candidatus Woesearchaeota archaeon]|nr:DMT family transporter [Candidatus Woesearchaeota archaeon]
MVLPAVLALTAAGFYGASSILVRRGLHGSNPHAGIIFSAIANVAVLSIVFLLFVPLSVLLSWKALLIFAIAGLLAPGLARLLRYTSLERVGVTRTGPITSASPIISTGLAVLLLGEELTARILLGTAMIIAGVLVASWRELDTNRADMIFAMGAAVLVGISMPIRKYGLNLLDAPIAAGAITALMALLMALLIIGLGGHIRKVSIHDRNMKFFLISGACVGVAFILNYTALSQAEVSVIGPLIQTAPIFALVLSQAFINHLEKVTREVTIGTLLAVAGAVLIGAA